MEFGWHTCTKTVYLTHSWQPGQYHRATWLRRGEQLAMARGVLGWCNWGIQTRTKFNMENPIQWGMAWNCIFKQVCRLNCSWGPWKSFLGSKLVVLMVKLWLSPLQTPVQVWLASTGYIDTKLNRWGCRYFQLHVVFFCRWMQWKASDSISWCSAQKDGTTVWLLRIPNKFAKVSQRNPKLFS